MPQRSNVFQKLVLWIQDSLVGSGASVTESAMVFDHHSKKEIEVDILIEFTQAGAHYRTCLECRDHSRKTGPA